MELSEYVKKSIAALTAGAADVSSQHTEVSFEVLIRPDKDGKFVAADASGPAVHSELKLSFKLTIAVGKKTAH
jgi:hypothetical protein